MYIIVIWLWMTLPPPILQRLLPSLLLEHNFASTNYKILHQIASKRPRASKSSQCDLAFQNTPTSEQLSLSQIFPNVTIYPKFHSYGNQPSLCHNFVTCLVMYTPKCQEGMYSGQSAYLVGFSQLFCFLTHYTLQDVIKLNLSMPCCRSNSDLLLSRILF